MQKQKEKKPNLVGPGKSEKETISERQYTMWKKKRMLLARVHC